MEFEHLRLCLGGIEDGLVSVRWWWKIWLDCLAMVDSLVGEGGGVRDMLGGGGCVITII